MNDKEHRWVGERFYDKHNDESFTVVADDGIFAIQQYDDGVAWDEARDPTVGVDSEMVHPDTGEPIDHPDKDVWTIADQLGVSEVGLEDERYVHLGPGPTIQRSRELCPEETDHEWFPLPSHLGWDDADLWWSNVPGMEDPLGRRVDVYPRIARCVRCGLSADVVMQHSSVEIPSVCDHCGDVLMPGDGNAFVSDSHLCSDCIEEELEKEETCGSCGETKSLVVTDEHGRHDYRFHWIREGWYEQFHHLFDVEVGEENIPICDDCWELTRE